MTADSLTEPGGADDATVISQSIAERERFALIYDRHAQAVHRYVARRLGSSVADDLLGEIFLVAFQQRDRYVPERPDARPWLYGIATNLMRRHRRTEMLQYRALQHTGVSPVDEGHADAVASSVTAQSVGRELGRALTRLRGGDRDVLLLVAWEELTYQEVADALDIPIGTVRSRLNRARRKLRAALREREATPIAEELTNG